MIICRILQWRTRKSAPPRRFLFLPGTLGLRSTTRSVLPFVQGGEESRGTGTSFLVVPAPPSSNPLCDGRRKAEMNREEARERAGVRRPRGFQDPLSGSPLDISDWARDNRAGGASASLRAAH